jgi:hypothetical protein
MLTKSRLTLATALVAAAIGAQPAFAGPIEPVDPRQQDMHASTVQRPDSVADARGEHAASLAQTSPQDDQRSPDTRVPVTSEPVVVEVSDPVSEGFDWTAAIIGLGAGLALAVLAGIGVNGARRRPSTV